MFGTGAHPVVVGQVYPADGARRIQQELGRTRHVATVDAGAGVKQIVAANSFRIRIRKNGEGVTGLLTQITRFFRSVYADRNRANPRLLKLVQTLLNAP